MKRVIQLIFFRKVPFDRQESLRLQYIIVVRIDMRMLPITRDLVITKNRVVSCFFRLAFKFVIQKTRSIIIDIFQILISGVHPLCAPDQCVYPPYRQQALPVDCLPQRDANPY